MTTQQFKYHVAQAVFQETTFKSLVKAINFNKEFLEWCQWLDNFNSPTPEPNLEEVSIDFFW